MMKEEKEGQKKKQMKKEKEGRKSEGDGGRSHSLCFNF